MDTPLLNQPFHWLKQIPGDLWGLDEVPLLGYSPPFPWEQTASDLSKTLEMGPLELIPGEWQWRSQDELFSGLGNKFRSIPLSVPPLEGNLYWVMPDQEAKRLANLLIANHTSSPVENMEEAFYTAIERFLIMETLNAWERLYSQGGLTPNVQEGETLPTEHSLCLDVSIKLGEKIIRGRLFLSKDFRKSWSQHFSEKSSTFLADSPHAEKLETVVHLEAGKVHLSSSEWKKIHIGDLVLLDSCSLDPDEDKGRVMLVINGIPFFRAKIKQGSLKILEHPLYHEVDVTMSPPNEKDEEDDEDLFSESDLDESFSADDFSDEEDDLSEEMSEADETSQIIEDEEEKETLTPQAEPKKIITSIEEIPLSIVVEVGRLQMSIKKLLELQPGNMLDLNIHPEAGVDLVLNGKRVAKGELLRIGDALGVRITELS